MSLFNARSRDPIRMTYRAVGSSTGQAEFLEMYTDFGAGGIPISTGKYNELNQGKSGPQMAHFPFALSSISFFYNLDDGGGVDGGVDGVDGVDEKINLNGCLVAKIFSRKITRWDDSELVAINPGLKGKDEDITVCRRTFGSFTAKTITQV